MESNASECINMGGSAALSSLVGAWRYKETGEKCYCNHPRPTIKKITRHVCS